MKRVVLLCAIMALTSGTVLAADFFDHTFAVSNGASDNARLDGPYMVGYSFTANSSFVINGLGRDDNAQVTTNHLVQLWDGGADASGSTLIASAIITPSTPLDSVGAQMASVDPVNIIAGHQYIIQSVEGGSADYWRSDNYTSAAGVNYNHALAQITGNTYNMDITGGTMSPFYYNYGNDAIMGCPTFNVAPEPITLAILGLGGLLIRRKNA